MLFANENLGAKITQILVNVGPFGPVAAEWAAADRSTRPEGLGLGLGLVQVFCRCPLEHRNFDKFGRNLRLKSSAGHDDKRLGLHADRFVRGGGL